MEGYRVFDYLADRSHVEPTLEGLRSYIASREREVDQRAYDTAIQYRDAIRRMQDDQQAGR